MADSSTPTSGAAQESLAAQLAHGIRARREAAGLSQRELAQQVGYSRQYVSHAEQVGRNLPSKELVTALDNVLKADGALVALRALGEAEREALRQHAAGSQLRVRKDSSPAGRPPLSDRGGVRDVATETIHAQIPVLRRVLDAHDLPEDGPVRSLAELRLVVASVVEKRLRSEYNDLSLGVPSLLSELHRAVKNCSVAQRPLFARLLVQVYRAADAIADKFGYYDLSARIIGLLAEAAVQGESDLLLGSSSYVRGETFFASGDLDTGRRILERAADRIQPADSETAAATYGTLHMRAAVMAGRAGHALHARSHIDEAHQVAQLVNEGIHLGTAFGAASVRIHRLALAVELSDVGAAIRLAGAWRPPATLPAERRSHFYVDLGRAYYLAGHSEHAIEMFHVARHIAPEHIHAHPQVGLIVEQMRITSRGAPSEALAALEQAVAPVVTRASNL